MLNFTTYAPVSGRYYYDSAKYPWGTFKDKSTPTANDGTPIALADIHRDWHGAAQRLMVLSKRTPSGTPDSANASDIVNSIFKTHYSAGYRADSPSATLGNPEKKEYSSMVSTAVENTAAQGLSYRLTASITGGGVYYGGAAYPGDVAIIKRTETYDVTGQTMFTFRSATLDVGTMKLLVYAPITKLTLTGIPKSARIYGVYVSAREDGVNAMGTKMSFEIDYTSGTWPILDAASGIWQSASSVPTDEVLIHIEYDPSDVD